ncbi:flavonol synthase/flavanone 3-hydroxylase [Marasmius fiardii PR-910]|nr:flavonol synthase/flavanone 3-hydroxylase [Marasmius fiardii PR-910]
MTISNGNANDSIPIIDFANFGDGTSPEAQEIGRKFFEACRDVGFAYLINTGLSQETVDGMFEWSAKFFSLPTSTKLKAPHPPEGWKHVGYSGIGLEQVSQNVFDPTELAEIRKAKFPDYKESFDVFGQIPEKRFDNVWLPEEDLPGFREYTEGYMKKCREVQMTRLLPALAIGMGLDKSYFLTYHQNGENQLRLLHYPSGPAKDFESGEKGRIGAHTDFSTCTMLFQDDVGGLEVESPSNPGVFIKAPPVKGAAVFNIGDFLMRWSNDTLKSTLHRVRAPPRKADDGEITRERFSIPYFMAADSKTTIDCIPGCFGPDRPKKYEPINASEYIDMRLNATYVK